MYYFLMSTETFKLKEKRKVCKTNYSLSVNLPKVWTRGFQINAGDIVEVELENTGTLRIRKLREVGKK